MSLVAFALTELVLSLTPGPAVLLVISQSVTAGFRASARGALGIISGNAIYFGLSALGVGALLVASEPLFQLIRILGALYLVWIGIRLIMGDHAPVEAQAKPSARTRSFFVQGLWTQLLNPKALLFFTALLPQFIVPEQGAFAVQLFTLAVVSVTVELPVLLVYGWVADRGRQRLSPRLSLLGGRAAGALLVGTGVSLVFRQDT
jgi:homoserine/homoserine lactone efflux protein